MYSLKVVTAICLVAILFLSCHDSNPSGPDGKGIVAGPTVTDADGNVYTSVVIGTQTWTVENLRTTKYNNGTSIQHVTGNTEWRFTTAAYCWHDNSTDAAYRQKWGALYNWYAVNTGKLAPEGWRVPTDADWSVLEDYLINNGYNWDGTTTGNKIAKALAASTEWSPSSTHGRPGNDPLSNNSSGFSALPGSFRSFVGSFFDQSHDGYWWSATESGAASGAYNRSIHYDHTENLRRSISDKQNGMSVRLLRDVK